MTSPTLLVVLLLVVSLAFNTRGYRVRLGLELGLGLGLGLGFGFGFGFWFGIGFGLGLGLAPYRKPLIQRVTEATPTPNPLPLPLTRALQEYQEESSTNLKNQLSVLRG